MKANSACHIIPLHGTLTCLDLFPLSLAESKMFLRPGPTTANPHRRRGSLEIPHREF